MGPELCDSCGIEMSDEEIEESYPNHLCHDCDEINYIQEVRCNGCFRVRDINMLQDGLCSICVIDINLQRLIDEIDDEVRECDICRVVVENYATIINGEETLHLCQPCAQRRVEEIIE